MEDKFDEMFNEQHKEIKNINTRIYTELIKKMIAVLLGLIVSVCLIVLTLSWGLDIYYTNVRYNPFKEEGAKAMYEQLFVDGVDVPFDALDGIEDNGKEYYYGSYNEYLMSSFVSTFFPGYVYSGDERIEDLGFGRYKVYGRFGELGLDINPDYILDFYTLDEDYSSLGVYSGYSNQFQRYYSNTSEITKSSYVNDTLIPEVEKMPDSSLFEVYVTYITPIELEDWNNLNIPTYDYRYALTRFGEDQLRNMGFTLKDGYGGFYMDKEAYISFENNTSEDFYEYYKMKLSILYEHEEFVDVLQQGFNEISDNLEIELKNIENREVDVEGYMAHVSKKEFLEILHDENTYTVVVKDVKYSIFE